MMKTGLVMEGGAMRGMFTAGILDVMMENGITFDGAIGVSAGAVFGCNLKSRQSGRSIRYNIRFCRDWRYCSWRSLLLTGSLYGRKFCYDEVPYKLDRFDLEEFRANPMEFYVVATDIVTGKAVYHKCEQGDGEDMDWMRASASMPVVSEIVKIGGQELLDGGCADSIPLKAFEEIGYPRNVVVLTQPAGFVKQPNKIMKLIERVMKKYPAFIETMRNRHVFYNEELEYIKKQEEAGACFVIRPPEALNIGQICHDRDELMRVYEIGRQTMKQQLPAMKAFLDR